MPNLRQNNEVHIAMKLVDHHVLLKHVSDVCRGAGCGHEHQNQVILRQQSIIRSTHDYIGAQQTGLFKLTHNTALTAFSIVHSFQYCTQLVCKRYSAWHFVTAGLAESVAKA